MGLAWPAPGRGEVQRRFSDGPHLSGSVLSSVTFCPVGPRNWGQSWQRAARRRRIMQYIRLGVPFLAGFRYNPRVMDTLSGLTVAELEEKLGAHGLEKWRAKPMLSWLHRRDIKSFDEMTDLSKEARARMPELFRLVETEVKGKHESPDGTTKFLVGLTDGDVIEAVLIPEGGRRTVCVSTQVGCPIRCVFCASGLQGLKRNLSAAEIVEQIIHVKRALGEGERISNVVIMGIGEPLLNPKNLMKALRILKASWGQGIGFNRITLSTVGVLGQLEELVKHRVTPNLALSLHAPNDEIRAEI